MKTESDRRDRTSRTMLAISFALFVLCGAAQTTKAQWTTTGNNISNTNSGNVGIGTTSPGVRGGSASGLNISKAGDAGVQVDATGGNNNVFYTGNTSGTGDMYVTNNASGRHIYLGNGSYTATQVTIDGSGNVGVGTTSPSQTLDVRSPSSTRIQAMAGAANGYGLLTATTDGSYSSYAEFGSFGSSYSGTLFGQSVGNWSFLYTAGASSNGLAIGTNSSKPLILGTGNTERLRIDSSGNVGIGTTSPVVRGGVAGGLNVSGPADTGIQLDSSGTNTNTFFTGNTRGTGNMYVTNNSAATMYLGVGSYTATQVAINSSGYVGIGKTNPTVALDVVGNINLTGTVNAKYQDVAEWVPSSEQLSAGTVVVLDSTKSNQVISSTVSYDTRVAGVISEQPGIALGEKSESKVLVATTGRVRVKVDATKGPIHVGDLLVTSDVPGVAMKSEPVNLGGVQLHRPGTLIGKALEPMENGKGTILVLLSLQ